MLITATKLDIEAMSLFVCLISSDVQTCAHQKMAKPTAHHGHAIFQRRSPTWSFQKTVKVHQKSRRPQNLSSVFWKDLPCFTELFYYILIFLHYQTVLLPGVHYKEHVTVSEKLRTLKTCLWIPEPSSVYSSGPTITEQLIDRIFYPESHLQVNWRR